MKLFKSNNMNLYMSVFYISLGYLMLVTLIGLYKFEYLKAPKEFSNLINNTNSVKSPKGLTGTARGDKTNILPGWAVTNSPDWDASNFKLYSSYSSTNDLHCGYSAPTIFGSLHATGVYVFACVEESLWGSGNITTPVYFTMSRDKIIPKAMMWKDEIFAQREKWLEAIRQKEMPVDESHGVHEYDGASYGHYGVTYVAVDELKRVGVLPDDADIDLTDPVDNRFVAALYLELMYTREGTWYKAVRAYHGADDGYADRVMNLVNEYITTFRD